MRFIRAFAFHVILGGCVTLSLAQQTRPADTPSTTTTTTPTTTTPAVAPGDLKKWMEQLGDEDWRSREAAQKSLLDAGDAVPSRSRDWRERRTIPRCDSGPKRSSAGSTLPAPSMMRRPGGVPAAMRTSSERRS